MLFAPGHLLPRGAARRVSALALFLLWWLLFRLTFQSGIVKLTSGDPTWRNLTALDFHFWTQPLPTWTAWYVSLLRAGAKKLMVVGTYLLEIGVAFLIFGPRPVRLAACGGVILMQLLIFGTGNYNFFNLLTIALALLLVDDAVWASVLPARLSQALQAPAPAAGALFPRLATTLLAVLLLAASSVKLWLSFFPYGSLPRVIARPMVWVAPRAGSDGSDPVPRPSAQVRARAVVRVSLHDVARAAGNGGMVESHPRGGIQPGGDLRPRRVSPLTAPTGTRDAAAAWRRPRSPRRPAPRS